MAAGRNTGCGLVALSPGIATVVCWSPAGAADFLRQYQVRGRIFISWSRVIQSRALNEGVAAGARRILSSHIGLIVTVCFSPFARPRGPVADR